MNKLTPILVIRQMEDCQLPTHLLDRHLSKTGGFKDHLAFNVGQKAVLEKQITTQGISFTTFFKEHLHPERIVLPVDAWVSVRVQETGQQFDLGFPEQLHPHEQGAGMWPEGITLIATSHLRSNSSTVQSVGSSVTAPLPVLRLVRVDGKEVAATKKEQDGSSQP